MSNITVIIAHRNYNNYLKSAIKSCQEQTINVNYIVIDDFSDVRPEFPSGKWNLIKNEFYEVYEELGTKNKFIFLKENLGPSSTRNIGIYESFNDSEYFQILDADDYMLPNKCERLLNEFDANTGVVYADYFIEKDKILRMEFKRRYSKEDLIRECIVHSGSMISKEALIECNENGNFYDPMLRCAEDYDLWLRISDKKMIKHVPEFLTIVKDHSSNSTNSINVETWEQCLYRVHQKRLMRNEKY